MPNHAHALRSAYLHNAVPPLTPLQKKTIKAIYHRAKWQERIRCNMCGRLIPQGKRHVDHMVPLSRGGLHVPENLDILCRKCNLKKGARRMDEIYHWYKSFDGEPCSPEYRAAMDEYYRGAEGGQTDWEVLRRMWDYPCVTIDIHPIDYEMVLARMEEREIEDVDLYLRRLIHEDIGVVADME